MDILEADILEREAERKKKKAEMLAEEAIRSPAALQDASGGGDANVDLQRQQFFKSNPVMQRMALDQEAQGLTSQEIPMRSAQVPRADAQGANISATAEALESPTSNLSQDQIMLAQEEKMAPTVQNQQNVLARAARLPQRETAQVPQMDQTGLKTAMQGYKMMEDGVIMEAGAQAAQLDQEAQVLQEKADEIKSINEAKAAQEQELLSKQREVYEKALKFNEEMKTKQIDTDRFWNSRDTGQKAMLRIGVFLMGVGGRDGLAALNTLIDRDIAAQKEALDRGMTAQDNMVSIMTKLYGNEMAGVQAAKAMALENLTSKIEAKMATTKSAEVRAKIPKLVGAIRVEQGKLLNNAAQEMFKAQVTKKKGTKLGTEAIRTISLTTEGKQAVDDIVAAFRDMDGSKWGRSRFGLSWLIGDNAYSESVNRFMETLPRLNTGAVINANEMTLFKALVPKVGDSKPVAERKLRKMQTLMNRRVQTMQQALGVEDGEFEMQSSDPRVRIVE